MKASEIIDKYIRFFEDRGHKRITNSPLVPENDPTTLFTSAGMQPLIPYLLGEKHPQGNRLANVQNCFRAADIDEVGDNRHTTFFRMLGNWSLGDYFKKEEIPWLWEFLTKELGLPKDKLYITVFSGDSNVPYDRQSEEIWKEVLSKEGLEPKIYSAGVDKNWWSRSGVPDNMPPLEIGGPDTEVYYKFDHQHGEGCEGDNPANCNCGVFLEIANSVFIEYQKQKDGFFKELPQKNVDFGGGLERLLAAVENKFDIHEVSLFTPIIRSIKEQTTLDGNISSIRRICDYFISSVMILSADVVPSNKDQGYILRRLLRRGFDDFDKLQGKNIEKVIESIVEAYKQTNPNLLEKFERIKLQILTEQQSYRRTLEGAKKLVEKEISRSAFGGKGKEIGGEIMGEVEIPSDLAFKAISSFGLSPTQLRSLGYSFSEGELAEKIKEHQNVSRSGAKKKFYRKVQKS